MAASQQVGSRGLAECRASAWQTREWQTKVRAAAGELSSPRTERALLCRRIFLPSTLSRDRRCMRLVRWLQPGRRAKGGSRQLLGFVKVSCLFSFPAFLVSQVQARETMRRAPQLVTFGAEGRLQGFLFSSFPFFPFFHFKFCKPEERMTKKRQHLSPLRQQHFWPEIGLAGESLPGQRRRR